MRRAAVIAVFLAMFPAGLAAGCGGSGEPLSREALVSEVNALCAGLAEEVENQERPTADGRHRPGEPRP